MIRNDSNGKAASVTGNFVIFGSIQANGYGGEHFVCSFSKKSKSYKTKESAFKAAQKWCEL